MKVIVSRVDAARVLACAVVVLGFGCWAAQASAYVYWSGLGGTIGRANLNGTGATLRYITGESRPAVGVAVDGQYVYWANARTGTIGRESLDGSPPSESFITGAHVPDGVAVNGQYIYWANYGRGTIGRAKIDGTDVKQRFIITGARQKPDGVAVNGQYIYWANAGTDTIGRATLDGTGTPSESFIIGAHAPEGVAVDGQHIYWANRDTGTIGRAKIDGTDAHQRFIRAPAADGVAVATSVPPWKLELTAVPESATIGTAVTITAVTNNILGGTPRYYINISAGGKVFKRCKMTTCAVSLSPGLGATTYEADVGPAHTKPYSKKAIVSATTGVDRTRPIICKPPNCL
jgi:sugar lactone lactonase YvrE